MTKRECLEKCRDHWQWLSENPELHKWSYPGFKDDKPAANYCYCCEFCCGGRKDKAGFPILMNCRKCPLKGYAWRNTKKRRYMCENDPLSLYNLWRRAKRLEVKAFIAREIARACISAILDCTSE